MRPWVFRRTSSLPQLQPGPGPMPEAEADPEHTRKLLQETMTMSNEFRARRAELESLKGSLAGPYQQESPCHPWELVECPHPVHLEHRRQRSVLRPAPMAGADSAQLHRQLPRRGVRRRIVLPQRRQTRLHMPPTSQGSERPARVVPALAKGVPLPGARAQTVSTLLEHRDRRMATHDSVDVNERQPHSVDKHESAYDVASSYETSTHTKSPESP